MTTLSGFRAADVIRKLRRAGFVLDRQARGSPDLDKSGYPRSCYHTVP